MYEYLWLKEVDKNEFPSITSKYICKNSYINFSKKNIPNSMCKMGFFVY